MAGKTFAMASVLAALAAFTGLVFALDGMAAARNDDDTAPAAIQPTATAPAGHNLRGARQSSRPWDDRLVDDRRLPAAFPPPLERRRHAA